MALELHDVIVDALNETTSAAKKEETLHTIKTVSSFLLLYSSALHWELKMCEIRLRQW